MDGQIKIYGQMCYVYMGKLKYMVKCVANLWATLNNGQISHHGQMHCKYMVKVNVHIWSNVSPIYGQNLKNWKWLNVTYLRLFRA